MRYSVAAAISSLALGAFLVNHWWASAQVARVEQQVRQQLGLPPGAPLPDFGIELPRRVLLSIQVDHAFQRLWFILIPLIFGACIGIGALVSLIQGKPSPPDPSSRVSPP